MTQRLSPEVTGAIEAFQAGEPVLVHDADDREGETDLLYPAGAVTPTAVARLRNDAGGLLFVALSDAVATALDLPFLHDIVVHPANDHADLRYDSRPSFSFSVNHRDTYTGVTDEDRSLTINALAEAAEAAVAGNYGSEDFGDEFRTPGHVHLLKAAPDLFASRQGHTEFAIALATAAGRAPAVAGCEMLDDATGGALPKHAARDYAERYGLTYVDGAALIEAL